jgi:hypothetical protein
VRAGATNKKEALMPWLTSSRAGLARALAGRLDRLRLTLDELEGRLREAVAAAVGTEVGGAVHAAVRAALAAGAPAPAEVCDRPWPSRRHSPYRGGIWEDSYDRDGEDPDGLPPEEADGGYDGGDDRYRDPAALPAAPRAARLAQSLACGLRTLAWSLNRRGRTPVWATLLLGVAAALAAYFGGTLLTVPAGLGGAAIGVAALTDLVRAAGQALHWLRQRPDP